MLEANKLARPIDLRRTLTHVKLSGRLADVIYSMEATNTDFYAYQFKTVVKILESPSNGLLIAEIARAFRIKMNEILMQM